DLDAVLVEDDVVARAVAVGAAAGVEVAQTWNTSGEQGRRRLFLVCEERLGALVYLLPYRVFRAHSFGRKTNSRKFLAYTGRLRAQRRVPVQQFGVVGEVDLV